MKGIMDKLDKSIFNVNEPLKAPRTLFRYLTDEERSLFLNLLRRTIRKIK